MKVVLRTQELDLLVKRNTIFFRNKNQNKKHKQKQKGLKCKVTE